MTFLLMIAWVSISTAIYFPVVGNERQFLQKLSADGRFAEEQDIREELTERLDLNRRAAIVGGLLLIVGPPALWFVTAKAFLNEKLK